MKAAVIHAHGDLDVVQVEEIDAPRPGPGEVVLNVVCAGPNHLDIWVRKGGKIVICGVTTGARAETDLYTLYWNLLTVLGSTMGSVEDFREMLQAAALHNLRPVMDEVFPLERVRDAMEKLEEDRQFGKIAIRIR